MMRKLPKKSLVTMSVTLLVLALAGAALAASGGLSIVFTGNEGATTAHGAQAPLGTLSATPGSEGEGPEVLGEETNPPGSDSTKPTTLPASTPAGAEAPTAVAHQGTGSSGGALPFTGYAVLTALILGAVLLLAGVALRRHGRSQAATE